MVVGAPKREKDPRLSCKLWEEPKGPDFVLEVVSRGTWRVDRDEKPKVYAKPGGGGVLAVRPDGGASGVADPGDAAGRRQVPGLAAGGVAVRCAEAAQCGLSPHLVLDNTRTALAFLDNPVTEGWP